jgi:tyrosine-protein kinase Etk/Wzc
MGIFSNVSAKMRKRRLEKAKKTMMDTEPYLLTKSSPFHLTESFRTLKASLSVSVAKQENRGVSIMVTSAFPKEGKTTVSCNLALMFAESNVKVVLVDADIRKGKVGKFFKRQNAPGLSDYLSGQASLDEICVPTEENPNLYVITCGTASPRPYEILESEKMKDLSEELKAKFDYVLYDTSPVLLVADALALAPVVDGAALVCRHMSSYIADMASALNKLTFAKVNILGLIVNDYQNQKQAKRKGYYHYKQYGYGYGYGTTAQKEEAVEESKEEIEN